MASSPGGFDAERLGGLQVDHQFEPGWLRDRQVSWLLALKNPRDLLSRSPNMPSRPVDRNFVSNPKTGLRPWIADPPTPTHWSRTLPVGSVFRLRGQRSGPPCILPHWVGRRSRAARRTSACKAEGHNARPSSWRHKGRGSTTPVTRVHGRGSEADRPRQATVVTGEVDPHIGETEPSPPPRHPSRPFILQPPPRLDLQPPRPLSLCTLPESRRHGQQRLEQRRKPRWLRNKTRSAISSLPWHSAIPINGSRLRASFPIPRREDTALCISDLWQAKGFPRTSSSNAQRSCQTTIQ
jgi:hypothetical protein